MSNLFRSHIGEEATLVKKVILVSKSYWLTSYIG